MLLAFYMTIETRYIKFLAITVDDSGLRGPKQWKAKPILLSSILDL